jgi:hypothetical protein
MVASLKRSMPEHYRCIARENLGNGQRAMLHYFGDLITRQDPKQSCDLLLIQGNKSPNPLLDDAQWKRIWAGSRKGNKNEYYQLYQRLGK